MSRPVGRSTRRSPNHGWVRAGLLTFIAIALLMVLLGQSMARPDELPVAETDPVATTTPVGES